MARIDTYITSKISAYARWIHDADDMSTLYSGVNFGPKDQAGRGNLPPISNIDHPNPGHSYSGTLTYTITPTLINEVTVAESWNTWSYYTLDNYASESRSLIPGLPTLFPVPPTAPAVLRARSMVTKTSCRRSALAASICRVVRPTAAPMVQARVPMRTSTRSTTYQDNISKVIGHHAFKAGFYLEKNNKIQPANKQFPGAFQFSPSTSDPVRNTNSGYVLALLGQTSQYQQATATTTENVQYYNIEFYLQDNWKVNRRLTLDVGVRFYGGTPQYDINGTAVNFRTDWYNPATAPRIYRPYCSNGAATCTASNTLVGRDPANR